MNNVSDYGLNLLRRMLDSEGIAFEAVVHHVPVYCYGRQDLPIFEQKIVNPCRQTYRIVNVRWWKTLDAKSLFANLKPGQSVYVRARGSGKRLPVHMLADRINPNDLKSLSQACGCPLAENGLRSDPLAYCYDFQELAPI